MDGIEVGLKKSNTNYYYLSRFVFRRRAASYMTLEEIQVIRNLQHVFRPLANSHKKRYIEELATFPLPTMVRGP